MLKKFLETKKHSFDEKYMRLAIKEAELAKAHGEAARGAVIAFPGSFVSAHQTVFTDKKPCNYAEFNALQKACNMTSKSFREAIIYTTTEPNAFCLSAIHEFGIPELVFGCWDDVNGAISSPRSLITSNFNITFMGGLLSEECYNVCSTTLRESLRYK
jgi:tRNA(adenine34) deaminase